VGPVVLGFFIFVVIGSCMPSNRLWIFLPVLCSMLAACYFWIPMCAPFPFTNIIHQFSFFPPWSWL
jgi:hypothetical protein